MKISSLIMLALTTTACSLLPAKSNSQQISPVMKTIMPANQDVVVTSVTLISREQKTPPLGIAKQPNRDIGLATVFVRLSNKLSLNVTVSIKNIEIRSVADGKLQNFYQPPQEIHLKPLENSEVAFHMANKTGYLDHGLVKAIVTYQINDQVAMIESVAVEIEKN